MELGFHTIHFSPMLGGTAALLDVVRAAGSAGFDAVGVDLAAIDAHHAAGGSLDEVKAAMEVAGVRCADVLVLAPGSDDPDVRATARRLASLAGHLGADVCIAAVAGPVDRSAVVRILRDSAAVLWEHGARLAIEFAPYGPLAALSDAVALSDEVGWHRCGLVIDSLHFFRSGAPWRELAQLDGDQIALVQYADALEEAPMDRTAESRHGRLVPGEGELPLGRFVGAVRATGFDGTVTAEVLSATLRQTDPLVAARQIHGAMVRHWLC